MCRDVKSKTASVESILTTEVRLKAMFNSLPEHKSCKRSSKKHLLLYYICASDLKFLEA